jgi:acyl-CoA synthetase (AMP-forming)/AMP-acid ligase II
VNGPAAQASTVRELIDAQAARHPQAVYALATEGGAPIRYRELALECRQVSAWLRAHGARPGDTVSLVMPNGLNTLRVLLGAMHGGFVVNPVNLLSQPEQMRHVLAHSDCRVVCVAPEWEARVRGLVEGLDRPVEVIVVVPDGEGLPHIEASTPSTIDFDADAAPHPDALALLMYTSGTTGLPKGVMLTHANLCANAHAISAEHSLTAADRVLAVLPLYHINAFAVTMLAPLAHGGSLAMAPKFSAARFWLQAIESRCTWLNVVPTMVSYLLEGDAAGVPLRAQTDAIRFCRSASAALPPEHHRAFEHRFGIGIIETMGLTETVAPSFSNPLDAAARKLGSVGRASGCEARVIDAALRVVADGVTGELAIRGPNVMRGYYKNDEATRAAFAPEGWLRTGDLGHRDADGFFFVTGRIKELIIKGGENIAPREIDEVLLRHPGVLEAAAVGIPDRHYGQQIMACIVAREGVPCTEESLRAFCVEHLGPFKTPSEFRFVDELPRGPSGKVQRLKLLELGG